MNVEYTGRQFEITPRIRQEVETGLAKLVKILGDNFKTKVILAVEKHRHKAEITISPRNHPLVGLAEAADMVAAINAAMERIEQQAVKYKARWRTKKRQPKDKWNGQSGQTQTELVAAVGASADTAVPLLAQVPLTLPLREQSDSGVPIVFSNPDDPAAQAVRYAAQGLIALSPVELPVRQQPAPAAAPKPVGMSLPMA